MQTMDINNKIRRYLNGEMAAAEAEEFLQMAKNDPFLADALEGYQISGASPNDTLELKSRVIKPKRTKLVRWTIGLSVAASLILIAFYTVSIMSPGIGHTGIKSAQNIIVIKPIIETVDTIENDDSVFISENNIRPYTAEIRIMPEKVIVPESIAPLYVNKQLIVENNIPDNQLESTYKYRSNHFYSYIGSFKVVDYRYDKRINKENLEIVDNSTVFTANRTNLIPASEMSYVGFLQNALDKYKNGNYHDALADFNIILDQYPNDANAVFYKALCYYKLGDNEKSLNLFDKTLASRVNTFHEESNWYKGLILKEEKQYAAAEKVLQEIVNDNGYYGVQAKIELDELYKIYVNE